VLTFALIGRQKAFKQGTLLDSKTKSQKSVFFLPDPHFFGSAVSKVVVTELQIFYIHFSK